MFEVFIIFKSSDKVSGKFSLPDSFYWYVSLCNLSSRCSEQNP